MRSVIYRQALCLIVFSAFVSVASLMPAAAAPSAVGTEARADTDWGSIPSGKFNLNYRIEGTGTPAIVIGFPLYYSRVFSQNLRSHLKLVFVDHRGSAASPGLVDTSEFAFEHILDDVELVRKTLHLGKIMIIGHSGQSFMALEYAKKYPKNVSHVVMIGASPNFSEISAMAANENWNNMASEERKSAFIENMTGITTGELAKLPPSDLFIKTYILHGPRAWYDPYFDATSLWEGEYMNMQMYNYVWGELLRDIDITVGLESFEHPVFLALGRHDFIVPPPPSWDLIRDRFHDLTIRIFEQSGHTPQYEEPALFDNELLTWMRLYD